MKLRIIAFYIALCPLVATAQNNTADKAKTQYEQFKQKAKNSYEEFRDKANKQYAEFLSKAWKTAKPSAGRVPPKENTVPPVIYKEENNEPQPPVIEDKKEKTTPPIIAKEDNKKEEKRNGKIAIRHNKDTKPVIIDDKMSDKERQEIAKQKKQQEELERKRQQEELERKRQQEELAKKKQQQEELERIRHQEELARKQREEEMRLKEKERQDYAIKDEDIITPPKPTPQPTPVAPIREQEDNGETLSFEFYGVKAKVRLGARHKFRMNSVKESEVSKAWNTLSSSAYNNVIRDCLTLRIQHNLCDWAYIDMINAMSETFLGKGTIESTMLTAFIYSQSGYKMRLGQTNGKLLLLFSTDFIIYNRMYFTENNTKWYIYNSPTGTFQMSYCNAAFPGEKSMSLVVGKEQKLGVKPSQMRTLTAKAYPQMSINIQENTALLPFFNEYPTSAMKDNSVSRWAMYANTPICTLTREQLYPQLRNSIEGKSNKEKVSMLLNWVQTAFVYEYDDKVWGGDRALFPDETLYYPYCDCEDRAILFTRLVKDLVGLKCALVYYPGHLGAAVALGAEATGDGIIIGGTTYTICDPTYIGAAVGMTMPKMNNKTAKVITL